MSRPKEYREKLVKLLTSYDNATAGYERAMRRGDRKAADDQLSNVIEIERTIAQLPEAACG